MFRARTEGGEVKTVVVMLIICSLLIPMFSVLIGPVSALVEPGVTTNQIPPGYGFIDFEEGTDGQVIRSTLPGLKFTTTLGYDWVYGDARTGHYNVRSLTDPSVNHGDYVTNGYFFAWLGPNMGEGRIDFVDEPASYLSVLTSTYSGLSIDAYDSDGNLIATSGWASGNLGTYVFTRLTVQAPNMAYVIIHDTGNYWLIDDLVTDAGGQHGLGPGPVNTCVQISSSSLFICETPGQSADIVATVSDQLGNPWPGVTVHFTTSGGELSATSVKTDSQGKATVVLSPRTLTSLFIATITATANSVSNSLIVIFYPQPTSPPSPSEINWRTNGEVFKIRSISASLPNWLISMAKAYNKIPFVQKVNIAKLENLRMTLYFITKASSATKEEFARDLSNFFGITVNTGYRPLAVLILEFPYEQIINALFDQNYHEQFSVPLPIPHDQTFLYDNTYLKSTPSGSFDYTITLSIPTGTDANQAIDLLSTLADSITLVVKKIAASKPLSVIQDAIKAAVGKIESIGDISFSMITSDLDQLGRLNSYSILDLKTMFDRLSAVSCIGLKVLDIIVNGLEGLGGILTAETAAGLAVALWAAKGAILTILDLGLEIIDLTPWSESFRDNSLYRILENAIGWAATASDPDGTIIVPSVYDSSGSLILGYNSTSSDVIYASTEGILIPIAGDWLALLQEDKDNPMNYTTVLNAVGGTAAVPYNLQILNSDPNATAVGYSGMVLGGTSITIPVNLAPDGTLIQEVYLDPVLSVSQTDNIFNFVATGFLSNGSLASVTKAFLIVNGSQYEMTQDNSSTFEFQESIDSRFPVRFVVCMISPSFPGGFATGVLLHDVAITDLTPCTTWAYASVSINMNVTATNLGDFTETVTINLFYNGTSGTGIICCENVTLTSNETQTLSFAWSTVGVAPCAGYNITATANLGQVVDNNLTNNVLQSPMSVQVRLLGDLNGDNTVDLSDAMTAAMSFGSYGPDALHLGSPADPNWNPAADLNGDRTIDIFDLIMLARNFGSTA